MDRVIVSDPADEQPNQHILGGQMDWEGLMKSAGFDTHDIIVTLINPVREGEWYKKGRMTGFKSGLFGGGYFDFNKGKPRSYDSTRRRWVKKPKVHVTYNIFTFGGKEHSDWVDIDNCLFEICRKDCEI